MVPQWGEGEQLVLWKGCKSLSIQGFDKRNKSACSVIQLFIYFIVVVNVKMCSLYNYLYALLNAVSWHPLFIIIIQHIRFSSYIVYILVMNKSCSFWLFIIIHSITRSIIQLCHFYKSCPVMQRFVHFIFVVNGSMWSP